MSWEWPPVAEHLYWILCESLSWFRSMKVKNTHKRARAHADMNGNADSKQESKLSA